MNLAEWSGILGAFLGFVLTLLVFSYIFGDNALFRFAVHGCRVYGGGSFL
jgi:hypothetical protein